MYSHQLETMVQVWYLITEGLGEMRTTPIECKEKCFQMMSSAYLPYSKAPQNVFMLMIHLRKRSGR